MIVVCKTYFLCLKKVLWRLMQQVVGFSFIARVNVSHPCEPGSSPMLYLFLFLFLFFGHVFGLKAVKRHGWFHTVDGLVGSYRYVHVCWVLLGGVGVRHPLLGIVSFGTEWALQRSRRGSWTSFPLGESYVSATAEVRPKKRLITRWMYSCLSGEPWEVLIFLP